VTDALLGLSAAKGWKLRELRQEGMPLEEVFVRLITAQPNASEGRGAKENRGGPAPRKEKAHA
jgi:hypothetical protein